MQTTESISRLRSCLAVAVPSGQAVIISKAAEVDLVFDPPWDASRMSDTARPQTGCFSGEQDE